MPSSKYQTGYKHNQDKKARAQLRGKLAEIGFVMFILALIIFSGAQAR